MFLAFWRSLPIISLVLTPSASYFMIPVDLETGLKKKNNQIHPQRLKNLIGKNTPRKMNGWNIIWVVVSNTFNFHPYLGKIPILTNIFQMG